MASGRACLNHQLVREPAPPRRLDARVLVLCTSSRGVPTKVRGLVLVEEEVAAEEWNEAGGFVVVEGGD